MLCKSTFIDSQILSICETGVRYQLFHGAALLAVGAIVQCTELNFQLPRRLLVLGTILFSFNCYCYTVTGFKIFAMVIPVGGTLLLVGWFLILLITLLKTRSS